MSEFDLHFFSSLFLVYSVRSNFLKLYHIHFFSFSFTFRLLSSSHSLDVRFKDFIWSVRIIQFAWPILSSVAF